MSTGGLSGQEFVRLMLDSVEKGRAIQDKQTEAVNQLTTAVTSLKESQEKDLASLKTDVQGVKADILKEVEVTANDREKVLLRLLVVLIFVVCGLAGFNVYQQATAAATGVIPSAEVPEISSEEPPKVADSAP